MIFVRFYRDDLVTGEPTIEVYFSILTVGAPIDRLHEQAVEFAKRHPTATAYKLFEGTNFRMAKAISFTHSLK